MSDESGSTLRRARAGSIAAAVSFAANLLVTLLLVPVLLAAWGAERYGSWLALLSLVGVLTTLDAGHHNYVGNELMRLCPTDRDAARRVLASALLAALGLGGLELLAAVLVLASGALPWALGQAERAVPEELAPALVLLMFSWLWQGSLGGVLARLYPALGLYARSVWWGIAYRVLSALSYGLCAWLGGGILAAAVTSTAMTLVYVALSLRDARARCAVVYPFWRGAERARALANLARSGVLTACALVTQLWQHGVLLWLSGSGGLAWVPAFTTTRTAANLFLQGAAVFTGPLLPEMVRLEALGEHRKLADMIRANWFVTGAPVNIGLCLALPLYEPSYRAWTGGAVPFERGLFAWLALGVSLRAFGAPLSALLAGLNALGAQVWISLAQAALSLGVLLFAPARYGLEAAGFSIALGELCASVILPVLLMARERPQLLRCLPHGTLLIAAAPCAITAVSLVGSAHGILPLPLAMALGLLIGGALYALQWSALGAPMRARLRGAVLTRRPDARPVDTAPNR